MVRPLDLENQIIFFTHCDFDIFIYIKDDLSELISVRRVLAIVIDLCFFLRCILEYDLFSLVKYNIELLIAEFDISLAQENITNL